MLLRSTTAEISAYGHRAVLRNFHPILLIAYHLIVTDILLWHTIIHCIRIPVSHHSNYPAPLENRKTKSDNCLKFCLNLPVIFISAFAILRFT